MAINDAGIYWPDEIFQGLEPAHNLLFGYGMLPPEFLLGARNWSFAWFVAGCLKLAQELGFTSPAQYLVFVRIIFSLISILTAYGIYLLSRIYCERFTALTAAIMFLLAAPLIYFAPRVMSENLSSAFVVFGLAFVLLPQTSLWKGPLGASLLGISVLLRMQNAVFLLALLIVFAVQRQRRKLLECVVVFSFFALLYGFIDRLSWGTWFHSAYIYLLAHYHGIASSFSVAPFYYYLLTIVSSLKSLALLLLLLSTLALRRAKGLFFVALAFLVAHSFVPHKEYRYILPFFPLFFALGAVGLQELTGIIKLRRRNLLPVLVVAVALYSAATFKELTFADLGHIVLKKEVSAFDKWGPVNRLLIAAYAERDLCGLYIEGIYLHLTGGYSYLHRPVPIYGRDKQPKSRTNYNYLITIRQSLTAGQLVAKDEPFSLIKLSNTHCLKDDSYLWRLP